MSEIQINDQMKNNTVNDVRSVANVAGLKIWRWLEEFEYKSHCIAFIFIVGFIIWSSIYFNPTHDIYVKVKIINDSTYIIPLKDFVKKYSQNDRVRVIINGKVYEQHMIEWYNFVRVPKNQ